MSTTSGLPRPLSLSDETRKSISVAFHKVKVISLENSKPASILSVGSKPFGRNYGEWAAEWWKWILSIPKEHNPLYDLKGSDAHIYQKHDSVFFLCQTYESQEVVPTRAVTVPASCILFLPIINWISILHLDGETDQELIDIANERMDLVRNLEISINGMRFNQGLEQYRILSPFFYVELPENNILSLPAGTRRAVTVGYWVFLNPNCNQLYITSEGSCSSGRTNIRVGYTISVAGL